MAIYQMPLAICQYCQLSSNFKVFKVKRRFKHSFKEIETNCDKIYVFVNGKPKL